MDSLTFIGLIVAAIAIVGGQWLEGANLLALVNGPAFLIVVGGTLGAVLLQTPFTIFRRALRQLSWVFKPPASQLQNTIQQITNWSQLVRREGLLVLDNELDKQTDPFIIKGLEGLIQGADPTLIRQTLELELDVQEDNELQATHVYESMGGYSPTIGVIGAVLGLIQVMKNLNDPTELGGGIAIAFVATVYGVGLANLLFLPIANKLKSVVNHQVRQKAMIIEGIVSIAQGNHPRQIENKLKGFTVGER